MPFSIIKIQSGFVGSLIGLAFAGPANASTVDDFGNETVTRMNDGLPVLIIKEGSTYTTTTDYDLANPAGRGKEGYATQRPISGDSVLNTNTGMSGAVVTPWVSGASFDLTSYGAGQLREMNRTIGELLSRMAYGPDGQECRAVRDYELVVNQFINQKKSRSRFVRGPTYRGDITFQ